MANHNEIADWVREIAGLEANADVEVATAPKRTSIRFRPKSGALVERVLEAHARRLTWGHLARALLPLGRSCTERD